jgi:hypothetical protein
MLSRAPETELQGTAIDGLSLSYRLRQADPRQRATWAKKLVTGEKQVGRLTRTQASAICNVPLPLVIKAVNGKKKPESQPSHASAICVTWWQQASFSDRVDFVRACGVSEVWDALSTAVV